MGLSCLVFPSLVFSSLSPIACLLLSSLSPFLFIFTFFYLPSYCHSLFYFFHLYFVIFFPFAIIPSTSLPFFLFFPLASFPLPFPSIFTFTFHFYLLPLHFYFLPIIALFHFPPPCSCPSVASIQSLISSYLPSSPFLSSSILSGSTCMPLLPSPPFPFLASLLSPPLEAGARFRSPTHHISLKVSRQRWERYFILIQHAKEHTSFPSSRNRSGRLIHCRRLGLFFYEIRFVCFASRVAWRQVRGESVTCGERLVHRVCLVDRRPRV